MLMFTKLMYWIVTQIARIHDWLGRLNNSGEIPLNYKQLHFVVIGLIGLFLIFIVYPIFKKLAEKNHTMVIAWIYVFTLMVVLTFAIEIGQGYTHTGVVEMADVVYGLAGFLFMFAIFSIIRMMYHLILKLIAMNRNAETQDEIKTQNH